ncbi:MAG: apolipoprotein N-acyltransferase [Ignavibacteriaceae bacterium]|nr:apolipoprotein N-acyltransferase [Ignavibacterium sp.]MCC6254542.1 apolipoprotein N-acyltransferase [Ignavibacteriaceae bacterium]HRN26869.1 apolipoprotein N-acyltransferase [Ignavibacteriaceae bacterium]HRP92649.1 apolipoprotein N-acyltransferase [Ignavibacteriaceae bacterium]HRQ54487.1 apolipoprotein N-acyltransferase [Ignavibacteriaceae bacterium]
MKFLFKKKVLSDIEKKERSKDWLLLILSGIFFGISFTPFPFPFPLFLFVAFVPYFFVITKKQTLLKVNSASYLTFFVMSLLTVYWVGSWQSESDPFLMLSGTVLVFFLPCVMLINSTLYFISKKVFKKDLSLYFFPFFWVMVEYLLTLTDLKFPWLTIGHGLAKFTSFIQIADIIGAFGLSFVVLWINIFIYKGIKSFKESSKAGLINLSIAGLIFSFIIAYGFIRITSLNNDEKKIKVGIIQPNLDPWNKWELGGLNEILNNNLELSQQCVDDGAKIIFWPETALPVYLLSGTYQTELDSIYSFLNKNNVSLLTGMPDYRIFETDAPQNAKYSEAGKYHYATYNSILLLQPNTFEVQRYGKMQLVPLGEHIPFVDQIPFLGDLLKWGVGLSGWNVGQDTTVFKFVDNQDTIKIGGLVCYESVFPTFPNYFVDRGAQFLAVLTNDSWYGKLSGPYQHKEFANLRAVENRRAVVRCANGGVSCLINKFGVTEVETEMFTRTHLVVDVPLNNEKTFYTKNPLIIPVLSSAFSLWIFGINILIWMKKKFKL